MTQTPEWENAMELFNAGEYWECHEALEATWLNTTDLDKHFLGGIILLAAALHKARVMGSARGGRRNYAKALKHLAVVPDFHFNLDLRQLEADVHSALRNPNIHPLISIKKGDDNVSVKTN